MPIISETIVEIIPTIREIRPPSNTRASRSRPELSVPIGCAHEKDPSGPVSGGIDLISTTLLGMKSYVYPVAALIIKGPLSETTVMVITTIQPKTASLFFNNRRQASFHSEVPNTVPEPSNKV